MIQAPAQYKRLVSSVPGDTAIPHGPFTVKPVFNDHLYNEIYYL